VIAIYMELVRQAASVGIEIASDSMELGQKAIRLWVNSSSAAVKGVSAMVKIVLLIQAVRLGCAFLGEVPLRVEL
jgi:hypothetical protein